MDSMTDDLVRFGRVAMLCSGLVIACGDDTQEATASGSASATEDSSGSASNTSPDPSSESSGGSGSASQTGDTSTGTTADTTAEGSSTSGDPTGDPTTSDDATLSESDTDASSSSTDPSASDSDDSSSSGSSGAVSASESDSESESDTDVPLCECAPGTDVIYVLSDDAELWSYDPLTNNFAFVGGFQCNFEAGTFSMGVDRNGIAWVMFQSGDLYTIDVNNPNMCVDPGYVPGGNGFQLFGMAFVSESVENPCDRLYGNTYSGGFGFQEGPNFGTLGEMDPDALTMSAIGFTNYDGAELTGTGDGRLFEFAGVNPAKLIELDKADASVIDILPLGTLELTNAFAFAHFGGDFYMFTENDTAVASQVTHLDYDDDDMTGMQELEVVESDAPIRIVGAGVSTCVPIINPQ